MRVLNESSLQHFLSSAEQDLANIYVISNLHFRALQLTLSFNEIKGDMSHCIGRQTVRDN